VWRPADDEIYFVLWRCRPQPCGHHHHSRVVHWLTIQRGRRTSFLILPFEIGRDMVYSGKTKTFKYTIAPKTNRSWSSGLFRRFGPRLSVSTSRDSSLGLLFLLRYILYRVAQGWFRNELSTESYALSTLPTLCNRKLFLLTFQCSHTSHDFLKTGVEI
jgi:hypothetical protein